MNISLIEEILRRVAGQELVTVLQDLLDGVRPDEAAEPRVGQAEQCGAQGGEPVPAHVQDDGLGRTSPPHLFRGTKARTFYFIMSLPFINHQSDKSL